MLGGVAGQAYEYGPFHAIPAMIEAVVDRHPHLPAVSYRDHTLSYQEFDELANGLAASLAGEGIGFGDAIGVLLGDGLELAVSYFALMKLGAVFVPLDPAWPAARLSSVRGILGNGPILGDGNLPIDLEVLPREPHRPESKVTGEDLIYGIFTSGTTGTPKCALNRHAGLTNRFRYMTHYFRATGAEVVLQNSRHTYDSSVWQLFWPLTTGGRTVIPQRGDFLDLEQTIGLIEEHQVTMTDFVPSVFNTLVSIVDGDPAQLDRIASLRELVVGGEQINPRMAHRLCELLPGLRITNGYGPTEASIGMVFHAVDARDGDQIPLGRPIDNCYAAVVDEDLRPVAQGEPGELVIGGVCLGAGYLADPARTAEVFVSNLLIGVPGELLYRTGDVARFDAEGRLHFLGRRDNQVKIGGVRIELGEIEAAAARHPDITDSKALPVPGRDVKALALFVSGPPTLTPASVREHLADLLPRHHVPRHIVTLAAMPLSGNGKVDQSALLAMLNAAASTEPADPVLRLFRTCLELPGLLADEEFHRVGGDSIQAMALVTVLRREFGLPVGVQDLFDHPTATAMANHIAQRQRIAGHDRTERLWSRDATMTSAMRVRPAAPRDARHALVTGATGFIGARLVHELLSATEMRVSCLVRPSGAADARARTIEALRAQHLWEQRFDDRLEVHAGDLSRSGLGLSAAAWNHLAAHCDVVLHNGALVNFLYDYRAHRGPNVLGTGEVLRLAMAHHAKPVHHVSTLGILDAEAARQVDSGGAPLPESVDVLSAPAPTAGYSQSKLLAEHVLLDAARRGAQVTIYRLGEIMPGEDGQPNPRAMTHLLLTAFQRLGVSPDVDMRSDFTPVDYTARRVVAGLRDPQTRGQVLHVFHPRSVSYTEVLDSNGRVLQRVSCREFLDRLGHAAANQQDPQLRMLLGLLPPTTDEAGARSMLARLLADNPRLFRRDRCAELEDRWGLEEASLTGPIAAYRDHLSRAIPGQT